MAVAAAAGAVEAMVEEVGPLAVVAAGRVAAVDSVAAALQVIGNQAEVPYDMD